MHTRVPCCVTIRVILTSPTIANDKYSQWIPTPYGSAMQHSTCKEITSWSPKYGKYSNRSHMMRTNSWSCYQPTISRIPQYQWAYWCTNPTCLTSQKLPCATPASFRNTIGTTFHWAARRWRRALLLWPMWSTLQTKPMWLCFSPLNWL